MSLYSFGATVLSNAKPSGRKALAQQVTANDDTLLMVLEHILNPCCTFKSEFMHVKFTSVDGWSVCNIMSIPTMWPLCTHLTGELDFRFISRAGIKLVREDLRGSLSLSGS